MMDRLLHQSIGKRTEADSTGFARLLQAIRLGILVVAGSVVVTACQTPAPSSLTEQQSKPNYAISLREGDTLVLTFPGAPNLNTTQQIRRDGMITLPLAGELTAAGLTPAQLEKQVLKLYEAQLQTKEVIVTLQSSSFPVFVTGSVLRPGKVLSDHPITALEAIMEAGGFDFNKANLKSVVVIRHEESQVRNFKLDLKPALHGKHSEPFYLKPSDIVYVPEKFSFF